MSVHVDCSLFSVDRVQFWQFWARTLDWRRLTSSLRNEGSSILPSRVSTRFLCDSPALVRDWALFSQPRLFFWCWLLDATWKNKGQVGYRLTDGTLTEVLINHRMAVLDVFGEQTCPSQAENSHQFELPVVEERLRNRLRRGQDPVAVISCLEGLPESTHDHRFGPDLEGQTLPFHDVFVRFAFYLVASHPRPVTQLVHKPVGHSIWYSLTGLMALSPGMNVGLSLNRHIGLSLCSRTLRSWVKMLWMWSRASSFECNVPRGVAWWLFGKSVTASALASPQFTEEKLRGSMSHALGLHSTGRGFWVSTMTIWNLCHWSNWSAIIRVSFWKATCVQACHQCDFGGGARRFISSWWIWEGGELCLWVRANEPVSLPGLVWIFLAIN